MQKKIISLAIAAAFAAPVLAMADSGNVVVYGQANVSYDILSTGTPTGAGATGGVTSNRVSSNSSRIGLKGTEDLGSGLSAIWQIESAVLMDGAGTSSLATRNTYAGLSSGSLGSLMLGRIDTPYKTSTRRLDVFADGIADNRSLMGGGEIANMYMHGADTSFDGRPKDSILYTTPNFNGFSGAVDINNGNTAAETITTSQSKKYTAYSLSGQYDVAPFYATVAYEMHSEHNIAGNDPTVSEKATKLGLGYTFMGFDLGLVYEKTSDDFFNEGMACDNGNAGTNCYGHSAYYLSGKYNINSSDAIKAAYTHTGNVGSAAAPATGAKQFSFGYDHAMSKRTTVYALYTKLKNDMNAQYALSGNATSGGDNSLNVSGTGTGASPSAFSLGVKHSF